MSAFLKAAFFAFGTFSCVVGLFALPVAYGQPAGPWMLLMAAVGLIHTTCFGIKMVAEAIEDMSRRRRNKLWVR